MTEATGGKVTQHLDAACLEIVNTYFRAEERKLSLSRGETLVTTGQDNRRLFFIHRGGLKGSTQSPTDGSLMPLVVLPGNLAGLQSFFMEPHVSKATLVAEVPTVIYWIEPQHFPDDVVPERALMPLLTHTMMRRQHLVQVLLEEQQRLIEQAARAERFELLGQFSAGVAHELNNALSVVERATTCIGQHIDLAAMHPELAAELEQLAVTGLPNRANPLPSAIRTFAQQHRLNSVQAGRLLRLGFDDVVAAKVARLVGQQGAGILDDCDLALAIHDGSLAAKQAAAVVASMRSLGAQKHAAESEFDLLETIERALVILRSVLRGIEVSIQAEASPLLGHAGSWVQVWSNLLKNAADAMRDAKTGDPQIAVVIVQRAGYYRITVTDNGPGIPADRQEQIFLPDFTTKRDGLAFGLGLGLPTVRRIVTDYGGTIVAGDGKDGGAQVTIRVPRPQNV